MSFNIPIAAPKVARLIELLELTSEDRVLDAGCGRGEFLIRVIEATGAQGLGVDIGAALIDEARSAAARRVADGRCEFRAADMGVEALEEGAFDVALCLGSTHAFGAGDAAYPNALRELSRVVRPGGRLLIGEGYWKCEPDPEYLAMLGEPTGIYHDHRGNVAFAEELGLIPLYATVSNGDEWDDFEWTHRMTVEREAAAHPEDEAWAAKLAASRAWRDGYLRWGRTTMGFGYYLFGKADGTNSAATVSS